MFMRPLLRRVLTAFCAASMLAACSGGQHSLPAAPGAQGVARRPMALMTSTPQPTPTPVATPSASPTATPCSSDDEDSRDDTKRDWHGDHHHHEGCEDDHHHHHHHDGGDDDHGDD